jgi:uncharacterized protein DUF6599
MPPVALADPTSPKLYEMLPSNIGDFHQLHTMRPLISLAKDGILGPPTLRLESNQSSSPFIGAEVEYVSPKRVRLTVEIVRFPGESDAYSFFTLVAKKMRESDPSEQIILSQVGTASVIATQQVAFFKGTTFLRVTDTNASSKQSEELLALARLFADRLDKGEGDIPVLVKHLPDWQNAQHKTIYAVNLDALKRELNNQPVLDAVSFEGKAEAVVAGYDSGQLVMVEFTTPQLAADNDRRINARILELRNQGQSVPSAYKRVGNYSVFVFNAPDVQTANRLIDQIKYEQMVQWLGDNPHWLEEAQRRYTETTLGVFIAVVKASGLALVLCFAIGGFFGAVLFSRRRAQQGAAGAYSDAGGMLRLNLDEMTANTEQARLIGRGSN